MGKYGLDNINKPAFDAAVQEIPFTKIEKIKDKLELYEITVNDITVDEQTGNLYAKDEFFNLIKTYKYYIKFNLAFIGLEGIIYLFPASYIADNGTDFIHYTSLASSDTIFDVYVNNTTKLISYTTKAISGGDTNGLKLAYLGTFAGDKTRLIIIPKSITSIDDLKDYLNTNNFKSNGNYLKCFVQNVEYVSGTDYVSLSFNCGIYLSNSKIYLLSRSVKRLNSDGSITFTMEYSMEMKVLTPYD